MSIKYKNLKSLKQIKTYSYSILLSVALLFIGVSLHVSAQDTQNADLIIGQEQSGSNLEVSLCLKSTSGKITIANVSNWLQYDKNSLTPGVIIEKGVYGNSTDGYGALKWQKVQGAEDKYTLSLGFSGDVQTPGQSGIQMQSNSPELLAKVNFNVIGNNKNIKLDSVKYYSTENASAPISLNIKNVEGDCRTSIIPSSNPIEQTNKPSNTNDTITNQIQNNSGSNNTTSKLSIQNETNLQASNFNRQQPDYDSVRTGGVNLNFVYILIFIITTLIYKTLKNNKINYFKV
jgi:hypothetical protein